MAVEALPHLPLLLLQNISLFYGVHDIIVCADGDGEHWRRHISEAARSGEWRVRFSLLREDSKIPRFQEGGALLVHCEHWLSCRDVLTPANNVWLSEFVDGDWPLRLDSNVLSYSHDLVNTSAVLWEHYKVKGKHHTKVFLGEWSLQRGLQVENEEKWERRSNLWGVELHNIVMPWTTWNILEENKAPAGLFPDLLSILENTLNFSQWISQPEDGSYGAENGGNWTGIVGYLVRNVGDFSSVGLTVTLKRKKAIDFGIVLLEDRFALYKLARHRKIPSHMNVAAYLKIFGVLAWVAIFATMAAIMGLAALADHSIHSIKDAYGPFLSRIWLPTSGSTNTEGVIKNSTKLLFLSAAFLTFMVTTCFSSDLVAHMATGKYEQLQNCKDIGKNSYKIFSPEGGVIEDLFSANGLFSECKGYNSPVPSNCGVDCAVELLAQDLGSYFYSPELLDQRLAEISSFPIMQPPASLAFQKDSELRGVFNHHLLRLLQGGTYAKLHYQWIGRHRSIHSQGESTAAALVDPISTDQLFFPMSIVAVGVMGSILVACFERAILLREFNWVS